MAPPDLDRDQCDCRKFQTPTQPTTSDRPERSDHTKRDLWYPEDQGDTKTAIDICSRCPSQEPCLAKALYLRDNHGIWGGKTPAQRRHLIATGKETAA